MLRRTGKSYRPCWGSCVDKRLRVALATDRLTVQTCQFAKLAQGNNQIGKTKPPETYASGGLKHELISQLIVKPVLFAVNVELEVLVVDFFVFAVRTQSCNALGEQSCQIFVALTNADASALAVNFFNGLHGAKDFTARTHVRADPLVKNHHVVNDSVNTAVL